MPDLVVAPNFAEVYVLRTNVGHLQVFNKAKASRHRRSISDAFRVDIRFSELFDFPALSERVSGHLRGHEHTSSDPASRSPSSPY